MPVSSIITSSRGENSPVLFLQLCPARIERIKRLLSRIHRSLCADETGSIHRVGGVFQFGTFGMHYLFGFFHSLLYGGVFTCFEVREFLSCWRRGRRSSRRLGG